jgi:hypothetical protein
MMNAQLMAAVSVLFLAHGSMSSAGGQVGASGHAITTEMLAAVASCGPRGFDVHCGPVYVDLESFRTKLGPFVTDTSSVEEWFGAPIRDIPKSEAYACKPGQLDTIEPCMMVHDGIHFQLDSATLDCDQLRIEVTHSWRRGAGVPGVGIMRHWFLFERVDGQWHARRGGLLAT